MKRVYILEFEMFDGEEHDKWTMVFETIEKAREKFEAVKENYKEFWGSFDTIEEDVDSLSAFDMGWYDNAYFEIEIVERDVE